MEGVKDAETKEKYLAQRESDIQAPAPQTHRQARRAKIRAARAARTPA